MRGTMRVKSNIQTAVRMVEHVHTPAGHSDGDVKPRAQNVPGGQGAEQLALVREGPAPYRPAGHRSGVDAPATQNDPGGHGDVHCSPKPTASLKVPAVQSVHSAAAARL
jgi:hypothetical protein